MKQVRISQFNDYVALDTIGESGQILETPIYLPKNKPKVHLMLDSEVNKWYKTKFTFDGKIIIWEDIDDNSMFKGMSDKFEPKELVSEYIKPLK